MTGQAHLLDELPCGAMTVAADGTLLAANATLAQWTGYAPEALIGRLVTTLFPQAGRLMWHTYVLPLLDSQELVEEASLMLQRAQGGSIDVLLNARRQTDADGRQLIHCICLRLQERRRLEYQLLTVKRVAQEAPGLLFQLRSDPQGRMGFTYVTEGMRALFGVSPAVALRDAAVVWAAVHPEDLAQMRQAMSDSAAQLAPWRLEYRVRLHGEDQWRETHASPTREPDGTVLWHGYTQDISERKRMEQSLRERDAAEQANQAKSSFLARMSHELRTPLNGILGFARLLKLQGAPLDEDQRRKVGYIESAGESLLHLINEVLEISRIESGHTSVNVQPMLLDEVLRQAMRLVSPLAAARQVRLMAPKRQGWWVLADEQRLQQVLNNLLSNAVKYGPPNGVVSLFVEDDARGVTLSVQDEGPGLSAAQQAQLFQPFNRLGAERSGIEGVGLGLVITRGLVELMGGQLSLVSQPGRGACFSVSLRGLPNEARPADATEDWVSTSPGELAELSADLPGLETARASGPEPVLYVEDNRVNAVLMQAVFETQSHYELTVVETGAEAITALSRLCPVALLLDMHLPDTDGIALLRRIRHLPGLASVPAVAVSADAMPADIERALDAGFAAYWTKPLNVSRLLVDLNELLCQAVTTPQLASRASSGTMAD
jgi:PAS domain S-box-containing protein